MCNVGKTIAILTPPFVYGYIWVTAEITVAIICASIPAMRPLFDKKAWIRQSATGQSGSLASNRSRLNGSQRTDDNITLKGMKLSSEGTNASSIYTTLDDPNENVDV